MVFIYIRPSVVMSVLFVVLSYSSCHVRMHPVTFIGVLCVEMAFISNSYVTQRQYRPMIFDLPEKSSLLMRIA